MKIMERPTIVQVTPHPGGRSAGVSAVAIGAAATNPVTMVGKIRRATNRDAGPPGHRRVIVACLVIGLAILFPLSAGS
jgi:hypothetical protein